MGDYVDSIVWGKWIALGCLIFAVITLVLSIRFYSVKRLQRGQPPVPGTGWMALPRYTPAETDREGIPQVAAPPYNPNVGEHDAGWYDKDGNFVPNPEVPERAHQESEPDREGIVLQELPNLNSPNGAAPGSPSHTRTQSTGGVGDASPNSSSRPPVASSTENPPRYSGESARHRGGSIV